MTKLFGYILLLAGASVTAMASQVPEVDITSAGTAFALLGGGLLLLRTRRKG